MDALLPSINPADTIWERSAPILKLPWISQLYWQPSQTLQILIRKNPLQYFRLKDCNLLLLGHYLQLGPIIYVDF